MGEVTPLERREPGAPARGQDLAVVRGLVRDGRWAEAHAVLGAQRSPDADALELRGTLAYLLGDSRGYFEDLAAAFRAHDRPDRAARCAAWLGTMHLIRGEAGHSRGWFSSARRLVDEHGECAASAYLRVLPILDDRTSEREEAIRTAREVHAIARRHDDTDAVALTGQTLGQLLIRTGEADEGRDLMDEAMVLAVSGQLSTPLVEVLVLLAVMESCRLLADVTRSREWAASVARLRARYPELAAFLGVFALDDAWLAWLAGDGDVALAALEDVDAALQGPAWQLRGDIHRQRGDLGAARTAYGRASGAAAGIALLEHVSGRTAAGAAEIRRALATTSDACDRALLLPAAVEVLLQDAPEEARAHADELAQIADLLASELLASRGCLAVAQVAAHRGDHDRALVQVRAAIAGFDALGVPAELARARTLAAEVHTDLGEPEAAALERAAADEIVARLGIAVGAAPAPAQAVPVSARELEVLQLLARGATNRDIAEALTLSPRTVDRHVSNIFAKVGVTTRAAAAAYAVEHGLA